MWQFNFDPWKLSCYLQTTSLKVNQTNKPKQKLHLLFSVPHAWAFFSQAFFTFTSFGWNPSPLVQMSSMTWQDRTSEVSGALGRRGKEERVWKDILNALLSWRITLLHVAFRYLCKMWALHPQTDEDQCFPRVTSCWRVGMKSPECLSFLSKPNGSPISSL